MAKCKKHSLKQSSATPPCVSLPDLRRALDEIDREILTAMNRRAEIARQIGMDETLAKIEAVIGGLRRPFASAPGSIREPQPVAVSATVDQSGYCTAVERAKEYIAAGDVIQAVLSQRLAAEIHCRPLDLYRALRSLNPSPYMYYLQFEDCQIVGSSPEIVQRPPATFRSG